ncbi:ATP-dependent 3'-5' DNA helicase [Knufia fluminis]|uniref:ATP-dependent 3'-5' DNA helicase n=1 Tax=Knufia fluminis TaxID=191047 RepID=A0AAN8EE52_9EURO|nr:ATP-dependent 3'-5' DNA helicase [Knufia fluminis]
MVKLQAATVSNQPVNRKRKRKQNDNDGPAAVEVGDEAAVATTTTTIPTKTADGGKKPRRTKGGTKPPLLERKSSTNLVESDIPWPEHFKHLSVLHKALNIVYTFCCTRKHFATTWDNIKSAVEGHIKKPLLVEDVAQVKALIPRAITFLYVDEEQLLTALQGTTEDISAGNTDAYERAAAEEAERQKRKKREEAQELLLFEFVDGDLKRQVIDPKTGQPTRATQKLRNEELKMPVFSQKSMLKLIDKRNLKFTSAINAHLNQCAADGVDAVEKILKDKDQYIPLPSSSRSNTPAPESNMPKTIPKERDSISNIVKEMTEQEWYTGQIVPDGHRVFDPQPAIYGDLNFPLSQNLVNALYNVKGISQLYSHQAEAINNLHEGHNVIVSTSTSSGKSLIYQVPMLHQLELDPESRGMYIFPTKALAQDQRRSMKELLSYLPSLENFLVDTFDGDTPMNERNLIRDEGRIIFTNPDMLHITILPQESTWRNFLKNLKYVVVDELHVYNGLFGAHVAFIMRRLRRICAALGNRKVKFISCSATVSNPEEHMKTIFGVDKVRLTDFDGSPSGRKEFICWNTPYKDPGDPSSGRGDAFAETARLLCNLIIRGVRVVAFCRVRKQCEVLLGAVKAYFQEIERPDYTALVMGYRGGYSAADRRRIEAEMFGGKLRGIVATTALELGVDIGSLDAVITMGFPYTIANLRQQSGRAGRRNQDSLSVLVGDCFPVDQHYMSNPDQIFTKPNCELQVDLTNELVVEGHIQCAAYEMPIQPTSTTDSTTNDTAYLGKNLSEVCKERLIPDPDGLGFYHTHPRFRPLPSKHVNIRDTEEDSFAVVDITHGRNIVLEEVEASRAFFTLYDGGIFLHQGRTYLVKDFRPDSKIARVQLVKVPYTTQQRDFTDVDPIETEQVRRITTPENPTNRVRAYFGRIKVHAVVFGFFKLDQKRRILDAVAVDNPPIDIYSRGLWIDIPTSALTILATKKYNLAAAIHAAEHAMMSLMPQFVVSMPGDVRTECKNALKEFAKKETQRKRPARLTFYDAKGGPAGMGIAAKAFEFVDLLLERAVERVGACHCVEGCTECICDERCKEKNMIMSKAGAEVILRSLLGMYIDVDALPEGDEERVPAGVETVVGAVEVMGRNGVRIAERDVVKRERTDDELIIIKDEDGEEVERGLHDIPLAGG